MPYNIDEIDLIVFASYTPSDTIGTVADYIQREYRIRNAKALYVSSACSSTINAMEIIKSFLDTGLSSKALMVCADRNSTFANENDPVSGHLWSDAAVSLFFSNQSFPENDLCVVDISSQSLAHIGQGPIGVYLNPLDGGLQMPNGKDVFMQACTLIAQNTRDILYNNHYTTAYSTYFIGNESSMRMLNNVS